LDTPKGILFGVYGAKLQNKVFIVFSGKQMEKGLIFNIQRYAIHDGPGIRVNIFFKGCPMRCWWCHNPESLKPEKEIIEKRKILDKNITIKENETVGKEMTVSEVLSEIGKEIPFFDESGGGVTFSGGEPLMQVDFLNAILEKCKERDIHTVLDTSGYAPPRVFISVVDKVDIILYDLKFINEGLHKKYTGVSNINVLENLKYLSEKRKNVIIRFPVIPGITIIEENIKNIAEFVVSLKGIEEINLLPYHKLAEEKYKIFCLENKMSGVNPLSDEEMIEVKVKFEKFGFNVKIGG